MPLVHVDEAATISDVTDEDVGACDQPRRRRTREDVTARICEAACTLFAERGYSGTTTREIARLAAVSETLLFRYFGSKAALFDAVVCAPFDTAIRTFLLRRPELSDEEVQAGEYDTYAAIYGLFEKNATLFTALLSSPPQREAEQSASPVGSLLSFFDEVTRQQQQIYDDAGEKPAFDVGIGVRLTFGMMAGSVLFRNWLFPEGLPPSDQIVATLHTLVSRGMNPQGAKPGAN